MKIRLATQGSESFSCDPLTFRVSRFEVIGRESALSVTEYDITDTDILGVVEWIHANFKTGDRFSIALVQGDGAGRLITFLFGGDLALPPGTPAEAWALARMNQLAC